VLPDFKALTELPLARLKRIMKSDEDVRMISAEAPVLFAKVGRRKGGGGAVSLSAPCALQRCHRARCPSSFFRRASFSCWT
jgi:hypothetical protein